MKLLLKRKERHSVTKTEKVEPDILSELKEMRSDMALLKDLSVEVSQIKESILQPQIVSTVFCQCAGLNQHATTPASVPTSTLFAAI